MIYEYFYAVALLLAVCSAAILEEPSNKNESERYFFFVGDDDHDLSMVDSTESVDEEFVQKYTSDPNNFGYWLFTRGNPVTPQIIQYKNDSTIMNSNFNKDKNTIFLTHGWRGSCNSDVNTMLTEGHCYTIGCQILAGYSISRVDKSFVNNRKCLYTYLTNLCLSHKENITKALLSNVTSLDGSLQRIVSDIPAFLQAQDVNVIVLDWSALASQNYTTAKRGVAAVGRGLGEFIRWLVDLGASYEGVHLVGFSLGGHVVGNAGRATGGKVKRITALDPAGPLFLLSPDSVNKTDGQYVEVIHTTLLIGHFPPCGAADFYPNGGVFQPGCFTDPCSHRRAYELMAASVQFNHLKANRCDDMVDMDFNKCTGQIELMGNTDLMQKSPGIFRLDTKREYPYKVYEARTQNYAFSKHGNNIN